MSLVPRIDESVRQRSGDPVISVVIPLLNERESLPPLHARLREVLDAMGKSYEILFVDDGSSDGSSEILKSLGEADRRVRRIHFTRNFGKSAALMAGFRHARGDLIITMDADLQDEAGEIPRLLEKLVEGYDVVSGWKHPRRDPPTKVFASRIFNSVVRLATGLRLHDINCGFKAYRAQAARSLKLYGDLHRFVPVLAHIRGYRVAEIPVHHHPRRRGRSKYGLPRLHRGAFDLMTVLFLAWYRRRPLHFFGSLGAMGILSGGTICAYLTVLWFLGERPIGNRPLLLFGVILIVVGIQMLTFGLLADMINAAWQRHDDLYLIRDVGGGHGDDA